MSPYNRHRFPPDIHSQLSGGTVEIFPPRLIEGSLALAATCILRLAAPLRNHLRIRGQIFCKVWYPEGKPRGLETPITPDEPDAGEELP
jgi:hypothetical protein